MGVVDEHMRAYYARRAAEYDDWWLGTGLFESRDRPGWDAESAQLIEVVSGLPAARTLDVACGTGFLTRHLKGEVVALDRSREMLAVAGTRLPRAELVAADAVPLPFDGDSFERVFTSHFYGHLLLDERRRFLGECRRVGRELLVVDSARRDEVQPEQWQERTLNDGSRHRVYKRFFTGPQLVDELGGGEILHAGRWFVAVSSPRG